MRLLTGPLLCHARMLGQPLLLPDSVKGRCGIWRCLLEQDQLFGGTLMRSEQTPDAWWAGHCPQTSCVFPCCQSGLPYHTLTPWECAGGFGYCQVGHIFFRRSDLLPPVQRACPGSSWQKGHPGMPPHLPDSSSETTADLQG